MAIRLQPGTGRPLGQPELVEKLSGGWSEYTRAALIAKETIASLEAENQRLRDEIDLATEVLNACYVPAPGGNAPLRTLAAWAGKELERRRRDDQEKEWKCSAKAVCRSLEPPDS